MAVRAKERQYETLYAARMLMFMIATRSVSVPRSLIVHVTMTTIMVVVRFVVGRRVLVAGLTTFEAGLGHGLQLSKAV